MSKYRLRLTPSVVRRWRPVIPALAVTGALCLAHDNLWAYVPVWLAAVCLIAIASLALLTARPALSDSDTEVLFDEARGWQQASCSEHLADSPQWMIGHASRATPIGLLLQLQQPSGVVVYRWVFRSECTDADYRRLARALR